MYAVLETGGKQYKVGVGDRIKVETLAGEPGDSITLDKVLLTGEGENVEVGSPHLETQVNATVIAHGRGDKVRFMKLRRRQNSRTQGGHRQNYTELEITAIGGKGAVKKKATKKVTKKATPKTASKKVANKPAETDDLSQINGVGPVIVNKLHELGITTFVQIAALKQDEIDSINEKLSFKGRIERDQWVAQAKKLAK